MHSMNYKNFSLILGFSVWLAATLSFRYWGNEFFLIENTLVIISLYVGVLPILFFLVKGVFRKYGLVEHERVKSVVLMSLPGMMLDVFCMKYHDLIFPLFSREEIIVFGSWVLWVYAIVLSIGLVQWTTQNHQLPNNIKSV